MRVLFLDCGWTLGYASFASGEPPQSGEVSIEGSYEDLGWAAIHFEQTLVDLIVRFKPDVLGYAELFVGMVPVFGKPGPGGKRSVRWQPVSPASIGPLFGFVFKLNELARKRRLDCVKIDENRARVAYLGEGNVPAKRKLIKPAIIAGGRQRGWSPCGEHAADALCGGSHVMSIMDGEENAHEQTPLFVNKPKKRNRNEVDARTS